MWMRSISYRRIRRSLNFRCAKTVKFNSARLIFASILASQMRIPASSSWNLGTVNIREAEACALRLLHVMWSQRPHAHLLQDICITITFMMERIRVCLQVQSLEKGSCTTQVLSDLFACCGKEHGVKCGARECATPSAHNMLPSRPHL